MTQRMTGMLRRVTRRLALVMAAVLALASSAAAATVTIAWDRNPEPSVLGYMVYVGTSAGTYTASYDVGNMTTFDLPNATPGTTYHFAVRAYASGTDVSPLSVNLAAAVPVAAVTTAPVPLAPTGTITSATPTFSWSAVKNATTYALWVDDAQQEGKIQQVYTAAQAGCAAGTGTCAVTPGVAMTAGAGNWWVMGSSAAGNGPWSAGKAFTISPVVDGSALYRINVGGGALTDTRGRTWSADNYFSGSTSTFAVAQSINQTQNSAIYQKVRYGNTFSYALPVPNGNYTVVLHLAELYFNAAGQRVFDVAAEGTVALPGVDVWAAGGQFTALRKTIPVTVKDGVLDLSFTSRANYANLSGLEVLAGTVTLDTPVYRINAGGAAVTDADGHAWTADTYFSGASLTFGVGQPISGTTNDALYQDVRYGSNFSYALPVTNGTYTVVLHVAELYYNAAGKRVFNVAAEGTPVLRNVDVWAEAGQFAALTKTMNVRVTDGVLDLSFMSVSDNANVSAIEILAPDVF
jgi:hypothetical protein